MLARTARRRWPPVAAFLVGVLLACAHLMWGPGHSGAMAMPGPMPGMAAMAGTATTAAEGAADSGPRQAVSGTGHAGCPVMSTDCPLATAHPPLPVALAAPGPSTPLRPPVASHASASTAEDGCAWPRAPDPVALLCVSRT
ncbi:hypothetical protein ACGFYU_01130 [Streptomyces sp. NPDC048337]|uniref:hypothetical protein n=1 Tax=Streptomyces sp. NPDC048337 TaxID=3365535 RepID=UPI00371A6E9B